MRELPTDKLTTVVEAFRVIQLLSETIFEAVVANDHIADEIATQVSEDAAIIAHRMNEAITILDDQYPGLIELIALADRRSQMRAKEILAKRDTAAPRH